MGNAGVTRVDELLRRAIRRGLPRPWAIAALSGSVGLLILALTLALWPGAGAVPGLGDYPFLDSIGWENFISASIAASAALFVVSSLTLFRRRLFTAGFAGLGALIAGTLLFAVTAIDGITVRAPNGPVVWVQPYPQTADVVLWGALACTFVWLTWLMETSETLPRIRLRRSRKSAAPTSLVK